MSGNFEHEALVVLKDIVKQLYLQNELLQRRNEQLTESIAVQRQGQQDYLDINKDAREALKMPEELHELEQQFAQALELWSCDVGIPIPQRFRELQERLPKPVWEDEQLDDLSERVVDEVLAERKRQMTDEEWTTAHDDLHHDQGNLALAAACYAACGHFLYNQNDRSIWPFGDEQAKKREKHPRRRRLVIAAAMLVAEIERLDRKEKR